MLARLGLGVEDVSTQVVPRDRHAALLQAIALAGAGLERLATEIRHLQRTEVREVEEPFRAGAQKGSSAMPHKRNPITTERITGLARVLRGNAQAAIENVALWHERDISHSGAERVILPDSTILLDYMQALAVRVVSGLVVHADRMRANLDLTHGALFSQRVLLALVESGMTRDEAYRIVQEDAQRAWDTGTPLRELIAARDARDRPRRGLRPLALHAPRAARSSRGSTRSPEPRRPPAQWIARIARIASSSAACARLDRRVEVAVGREPEAERAVVGEDADAEALVGRVERDHRMRREHARAAHVERELRARDVRDDDVERRALAARARHQRGDERRPEAGRLDHQRAGGDAPRALGAPSCAR